MNNQQPPAFHFHGTGQGSAPTTNQAPSTHTHQGTPQVTHQGPSKTKTPTAATQHISQPAQSLPNLQPFNQTPTNHVITDIDHFIK